MTRFRALRLLMAVLTAAAAFTVADAHAANWGKVATISSTMGVSPNRVCVGEGTRPTDIGCPSTGPEVVPGGVIIDNGGLTVAGSISSSAVSATFISGTVIQVNSSAMTCGAGLGGTIRYNSGELQYCDGVGPGWQSLANGSSIQGDRIVSGTATMIANKDRGISTSVPLTVSGDLIVGYGKAIYGTTTAGAKAQIAGYATYDATILGGPASQIQFYTQNSGRFFMNGTSFGVMTSSPRRALDVLATSGPQARLTYTDNSVYTDLQTNSGGNLVVTPSGGGAQFTGAVSATNAIQPGASSLTCASNIYGAVRWNATSNTIDVCNSVGWTSLASGTGGTGTLTGAGSATAVAFWNGTNSLTYESTTTSGLYWDHTNGYLGVGVDRALRPLHVLGAKQSDTGDGYSIFRLQDTSAYNAQPQPGIMFAGYYNSTSATAGWADINAPKENAGDGDYAGALTFHTRPNGGNITERMRITSAGNVGIGTSAPGSSLTVVGTSSANVQGEFQTKAGVGGHWTIYGSNFALGNYNNMVQAGDHGIVFSDGSAGSGALTITPWSNGSGLRITSMSVAVGNASGSSLTVAGEVQPGTSGAACVTATNGGAIRYSAGTLYYCNGSNTWSSITGGGAGFTGGGSATAVAFWNGANSLTYESATTSGLYWDHTNGRLGIGMNNPSFGVEVSSGVGGIRVYSNSSTLPAFEADTSVSSNLAYLRLRKAGKARWDLGANGAPESGGNVGSDLYVNRFADNEAFLGTPFLIQRSSGNVGIGTANPAAQLDVSGTARLTYSGTQLTLNNPTAGEQAMAAFSVNNAVKWQLGKQTDDSFLLYNAGTGKIDFSVSATTDNVSLIPDGGAVTVGGAAVGSSLTVLNGEIQPGSSGAACVTATNGGAIRYSAGTLYYCDGSNTWSSITGGGAGFVGGGSATAVAFWNGPNSLTYESATTSGLYWNHASGTLGLGTMAPNYPLHVSGTGPVAYFGNNNFVDQYIGIRNFTAGVMLGLDTSFNGGSGLLQTGTTKGFAVVTGNSTWGSFTIPAFYVASGGNVGVGVVTPTATLQVSGTFTVSQTGQNTASAASMLVDNRGVSVSSIVHITGSAFSPIGAGGNAILSGTTAVSTSSAGSITFYTGGSQRIGIDVNGNVGIGTTTPSVALNLYKASGTNTMRVQSGAGIADLSTDGTTLYLTNYVSGAPEIFTATGNGYHQFWTNGSPRMTIDGSGNVGIGTTSSTPNPGIWMNPTGTMSVGNNAQASGWAFMGFWRSGVGIGSITQNGTTAVAYNTTSDRRVKENITDSREGLQQLMQISVKDFSFKADPSHTMVNGFIAQDLNMVYPEAVTTNGDNGDVPLKDKSKIWQVDYGRVTPLIVKAVQDLKHLFDDNQAQTDAKLKAANDNIQSLSNEVDELRQEVRQLKQQK